MSAAFGQRSRLLPDAVGYWLTRSVFGQSSWFSLNAGRFLVDDGEGFDLDHELRQSQFVDPDERIGR